MRQHEDLIERNIFVVEDNSSDFKFIKMALREMKFDVSTEYLHHIPNGEEALARLKSSDKTPDLIYLDIEMRPDGVDGIDVLKEIKDSRKLKEIPVVVMSGNENLLELVEGTADDFFYKGTFFDLTASTKESAQKFLLK